MSSSVDVLVIGGGVAGIVAAIAARSAGAQVRLAEAGPQWMRGGNTRHARNLRLAHDGPDARMPGAYGAEDLLADMRRVAGGDIDEALAQALACGAGSIGDWLAANGVRFLTPGRGVAPLSHRTAFFLGGGRAAVSALYATAARIGVDVAYDTEVRGLEFEGGRIVSAELAGCGAAERVAPATVIACAGGHQANRSWLREIYGPGADSIVVRGSPYVTGHVLRALIDAGARTAGDPASAHFVAVDGRGPASDGGIVTRIECIPYGIVVDVNGARFADEGADLRRTHYARWGERLLEAPRAMAFSILDADGLARAPSSGLAPVQAESLEDLATALGLPPARLTETVSRYNDSLPSPDELAHARPLASPPFFGYPLRPGITFTRYGVAVDPAMRVRRAGDGVYDNLFAAGMIMAATILPRAYLAGLGVTLSAAFGRMAGEEAARHACR